MCAEQMIWLLFVFDIMTEVIHTQTLKKHCGVDSIFENSMMQEKLIGTSVDDEFFSRMIKSAEGCEERRTLEMWPVRSNFALDGFRIFINKIFIIKLVILFKIHLFHYVFFKRSKLWKMV